MKTIINPLTCREIEMGKYTFQKLVKEDIIFPDGTLTPNGKKQMKCKSIKSPKKSPKSPKSAKSPKSPKGDEYFNSKSVDSISDTQKRYCRCVLHVAAKNKKECNISKGISDKKSRTSDCVNPYAICRKNIKPETKYCAEYYDYSNIPDRELVAFAELHWDNIEIPEPYNRRKMLNNIKKWKMEYKK